MGIDRFHLVPDAGPVPGAEAVVFADGSADSSFRPGVDLELSHWVPTSTPSQWAADTSTEICLRFLADPPDAEYDLAVNNHIDVDGVLSIFVLLHPELAAAHPEVIIGAAEHGDLQASAGRESVVLAQELTQIATRAEPGASMRALYVESFALVRAILEGEHVESAAAAGAWDHLERGHHLLDDGAVEVRVVADHLASFAWSPADLDRAIAIPPFNAVIDDSVQLWPHARNRDHGERVHLVSVESADGWHHDVWLPGYCWAHTPDRWRVAGLRATGGSNSWSFESTAMTGACARLDEVEHGPGRWTVASHLTPFSALTGRGFPVVAAFVGSDGEPAASSVSPDVVAEAMADVFET